MFFILISSILSLIFSYIFFSINPELISEGNFGIFDFLSGTILIPLIFDYISKYADKVKNNLISNKQ